MHPTSRASSERRSGIAVEKTFAEFFAGIGLVRLGLQKAGWKAKFANDIDDKKLEMYWNNFSDTIETFLPGDIHELTPSDIPDVTLATASFPCTDLSLAGSRRGLAGKQSGAFWGFTRLLDGLNGRRPPLILIENVPAFLTSRYGRDFSSAIRRLNELGYSCDAFVLNASNFTPQSRARLFIVGMFDSPRTDDIKVALARRAPELKPRQLTDRIVDSSNLSWTIIDIPPPPQTSRSLAHVLQKLPVDSARWWPNERVEYLLGQMSERHVQVTEALIRSRKLGYATVYRRVRYGRSMAEVRADGIAGCLRTPKGGSSRQILLVAGKGKLRARFMTPREYARLQGVPDSYMINVPDNQAYFGFGDAVCVPAIEWIGTNVLDPLVTKLTGSGIRASAI